MREIGNFRLRMLIGGVRHSVPNGSIFEQQRCRRGRDSLRGSRLLLGIFSDVVFGVSGHRLTLPHCEIALRLGPARN